MGIRRHLSVLATAAIFASFLAPSAALAASGGACISNSGAPYQAGLFSNPASGIYSAKAVIDPDAPSFYNCGQFQNGWSFSAAWVGIQDSSGNGLVQLGVLECDPDSGGPTWCKAGTTPRVMAAARGCIIGENRYDLGPLPDWTAHTYEIDVDVFRTPNHVGFFMDGLQIWSIPTQDPMIACWIRNTTNNASWFGERGNRGDSLGQSSSVSLKYTSIRFGYGLTPNNIPLEINCSKAQPSSGTGVAGCIYLNNTGLMRVWTVY